MDLSDFDYKLPKNLIAQEPVTPRHSSRLLILDRTRGEIEHQKFINLDKFLKKGDVLVFNNSQVAPMRLIGSKETGGKVEILLLQPEKKEKNLWGSDWKVLSKPGIKLGQKIFFGKSLEAEVVSIDGYERVIKFNKKGKELEKEIWKRGEMPIPPYIKGGGLSKNQLVKKYQTIYAKEVGSAAAPTAGFHFSKVLMNKLKKLGVQFEFVTLHVGLGTFQPVKEEKIEDHQMHEEWIEIPSLVAKRLNKAKKEGRRIIAVGTTSVRVLESFSNKEGVLSSGSKSTDIFIYPGYKFEFIEGLITNFHLPKSSLLMLVSAFASLRLIKKAYEEAIKGKYRFYSFGDGMFIL